MPAPVLGSTTLPLPTSADRSEERVEEAVVLAGGSERFYVRGYRLAWSLSWRRKDRATVDAIVAAARVPGTVAFTDTDGLATTVRVSSPPQVTPVAGTDPQRYDVEVDLREPDVRTF